MFAPSGDGPGKLHRRVRLGWVRGRPKCHAIPAQSIYCRTNRSLRAAIKAAPYGGHVPAIDERRPRRGRIRLAPCRSEAKAWGIVSHSVNASSKRANLLHRLALSCIVPASQKVRPLRGRLNLCCCVNPRFRLRLDLGLTVFAPFGDVLACIVAVPPWG